ncbi:ELAV-like protein 3 [Acropora cervicornis]|uniref:ELAV-like protein 3 n=1 Tax=Acropora cervicornis TaxID=6130 RepID=A0AAD9R4D5_ACRCE|nr:ELAV-like protein 3 [Acropora cervicornis]
MAEEGSNAAETENKTNLIINYLPQTLTDLEFKALFQSIGPTKSCKVCRHRSTGYSYGFGFVEYFTPEHAQLAIDTLNGHQLQNKFIKVALSRKGGDRNKGANLYIRNIPKTWTSEDLRELFKPYGNIINSKVLTEPMSGSSKGVGFILYDLKTEAEAAIAAVNNTIPTGSSEIMYVRFADDNVTKVKPPPEATTPEIPQRPSFNLGQQQHHQGAIGPMGQALINRRANRFNPMFAGPQIPPPSSGFNQMPNSGANGAGFTLFVYNIGASATQASVYKLFSPYGEVTKINVMWDWEKGQCKGFCFVTMATWQQAQDAIRALNGYIYDQYPLQVKLKT